MLIYFVIGFLDLCASQPLSLLENILSICYGLSFASKCKGPCHPSLEIIVPLSCSSCNLLLVLVPI